MNNKFMTSREEDLHNCVEDLKQKVDKYHWFLKSCAFYSDCKGLVSDFYLQEFEKVFKIEKNEKYEENGIEKDA